MIGLFDSGIGGLSVLREIASASSGVDLLYVADRARAPYGPRPLEVVRQMSHQVVDWMAARWSIETIVIACNTASAAALDSLRRSRPDVTFVGMEPAVKPAAAVSRSGVIGVLATKSTFDGRLFHSVVGRYAGAGEVVARACPGWVEMVEQGLVHGPEIETAISREVEPLLARGADTLVIACTHFSFLGHVIRRVSGPGVEVIDPASAVAARALQVSGTGDGSSRLTLAASGELEEFERMADRIAGVKASGPVLPFPS